MLHDTILEAWRQYCVNVLDPSINVIFAEESGPRPPKPYVTLKIISGPRRLTIDDEMRDNGAGGFALFGQRGYTLSVKSYGVGHIDILEDVSTCIEDPANYEKLRADADIAVVRREAIQDISGLIETGFEKRGSLDIIFNSSNNKTIDIGTIESVEVKGTLDTGTKTINTNMPIISKE